MWSQEVDKKDSLVQYCLVLYNLKNEAIVIDMYTTTTYYVVNESNERMTYPSSIALLNFMAEHGWIYQERFSDRNWGGTHVPSLLFKKKGRRGDDWFNGIRLQKNE